MTRTIIIRFIALFISILFTVRLSAQERFLTPSNNAKEVSTTPTVKLRTSFPIIADSISDSSFYFLEGKLRDSLPISSWSFLDIKVTPTIDDDTTVAISPHGLDICKRYAVSPRCLWVDSLGTPVKVSRNTCVSFTTLSLPHFVAGNSLLAGNHLINCHDTIRLHYNRPLDSLNTPSGLLVSLYRQRPNPADTATDTLAGVPYLIDSLEASTQWLSSTDSSYLFVTSSVFVPGAQYFLRTNSGRLTGDSASDDGTMFKVRAQFTVGVSYSGGPLLPPSLFRADTLTRDFGDTVTLLAPSFSGCYQFSHWHLSFQGDSTSDTLQIAPTCSNLGSFFAQAVYAPAPIDTVILTVPTVGLVNVPSSGLVEKTDDTSSRVDTTARYTLNLL